MAIVEIKGVKIDVDLRPAQTVETFKVGDPVKVLIKEFSNYAAYPGIIIGFDAFKIRPTINVCYTKVSYGCAELVLLSINEDTKDAEICHTETADLCLEKQDCLDKLNAEIEKKKAEIADIQRKQAYFLKHFGKYFSGK
jgi:hypothetical protein